MGDFPRRLSGQNLAAAFCQNTDTKKIRAGNKLGELSKIAPFKGANRKLAVLPTEYQIPNP